MSIINIKLEIFFGYTLCILYTNKRIINIFFLMFELMLCYGNIILYCVSNHIF